MKSPAPFLNSRPHKPGREGTLSLHVLQRCAKAGGWGGRVPGRAAPRVALSKQFLLPGDGKTGERVGLGTWGSLCTAVYIQGCSPSGTRCGRLCVCEPPFPCPAEGL